MPRQRIYSLHIPLRQCHCAEDGSIVAFLFVLSAVLSPFYLHCSTRPYNLISFKSYWHNLLLKIRLPPDWNAKLSISTSFYFYDAFHFSQVFLSVVQNSMLSIRETELKLNNVRALHDITPIPTNIPSHHKKLMLKISIHKLSALLAGQTLTPPSHQSKGSSNSFQCYNILHATKSRIHTHTHTLPPQCKQTKN